MEINQQSFLDGFTRQYDATRISRSAYPLLVNGRNRNDTIRPILKPQQITTGVPTGVTLQGIYATDTRALLFAGGQAYYRDFSSANTSFLPLGAPALDANVYRIYAELVPASSLNLNRTSQSPTSEVNLANAITGSPSVVVCQDGITQPVLIFNDGNSRSAKAYGNWTKSEPEYVPIGRQMLYDSTQGKLYVVLPNNKIAGSVSGRPLDFVIAVDSNGEKTNDADLMAHGVSYDPITAIRRTNVDNGFLVCTQRASWTVYATGELIFGEPKLSNQFLFDTGANNQFSVCELLGDTSLVDISSVRSFNAIQMLKNEGKNSPFSRAINELFDGVLQQNFSCSIAFDNYAMYSVKTIYGNVVIIYDNITEKFVGFDLYEGVGAVKQYAEIKVNNTRRLLFITDDNKLYEFEAGTERETCSIYLGEFTTNNPKINVKPNVAKAVFINPYESGTINAQLFVDNKSDVTLRDHIKETITRQTSPIDLPFGQSDKDAVKTLTFPWTQSCNGWKCGVLLSWNFDAALSHFMLEVEEQQQINTFEQQQIDQAKYTGSTRIELHGFTPLMGVPSQIMSITGTGLTNVTAVKIGSVSVTFTIVNDNLITLILPLNVEEGVVTLISPYDEIESEATFSIGS